MVFEEQKALQRKRANFLFRTWMLCLKKIRGTFYKFFKPDFCVLLCTLGLTFIGLITLASISQSFGLGKSYFLQKQIAILVPSLCLFYLTYKLNWEFIGRYTFLISFLGLLLLALILVPGLGVRVNGAQRWLNLGVLRLQASEFAKAILILTLAHYYSKNQRYIQTLYKGFLVPLTIITLFSGLIMLEPDFGTAFLCGLVGFSLMFLVGVRLCYLLPCIGSGLGLFALAIFLNPVRLKRITSFLDLEGNKSEGAYQLWQGILAFGSGGISGVGIGNGRQQVSFLPEAHTDFIFPIIGEELGLFFSLLVVLLFLILFLVGSATLKQAPNLRIFVMGYGSLLFITIQAIINMGVVTGILPTKGMCLPFISYGGASLMGMFILLGMLLHCFKVCEKPNITKVNNL